MTHPTDTPPDGRLLHDVEQAAAASKAAADDLTAARGQLAAAVRDASAGGHTPSAIAHAADMSRTHVYRLIGA